MGEGETIRYYTKVVPTTLVALDGRKTYSHQCTANANVYRSGAARTSQGRHCHFD